MTANQHPLPLLRLLAVFCASKISQPSTIPDGSPAASKHSPYYPFNGIATTIKWKEKKNDVLLPTADSNAFIKQSKEYHDQRIP